MRQVGSAVHFPLDLASALQHHPRHDQLHEHTPLRLTPGFSEQLRARSFSNQPPVGMEKVTPPMSSLNTLEQQLAQLRQQAERKIKVERELVAAAVNSGILPTGTRHLHSRPAQFPGWHAAVARSLFDMTELRAYGLSVSLTRFTVVDGALEAEFDDDTPSVVVRLLNDSLSAATRNACCNCGEPRDNHPMSLERLSCASCVAVDLMFENDIKAKAAAAWVPLTIR